MKIKDVSLVGPEQLKRLVLSLPDDEVFTTEEIGQKLNIEAHRYPLIRAWLKTLPGCSFSSAPRQKVWVGNEKAIKALKKMHGIS